VNTRLQDVLADRAGRCLCCQVRVEGAPAWSLTFTPPDLQVLRVPLCQDCYAAGPAGTARRMRVAALTAHPEIAGRLLRLAGLFETVGDDWTILGVIDEQQTQGN
jgi:hypothetical protein